jgi:hypothetical protein
MPSHLDALAPVAAEAEAAEELVVGEYGRRRLSER